MLTILEVQIDPQVPNRVSEDVPVLERAHDWVRYLNARHAAGAGEGSPFSPVEDGARFSCVLSAARSFQLAWCGASTLIARVPLLPLIMRSASPTWTVEVVPRSRKFGSRSQARPQGFPEVGQVDHPSSRLPLAGAQSPGEAVRKMLPV